MADHSNTNETPASMDGKSEPIALKLTADPSTGCRAVNEGQGPRKVINLVPFADVVLRINGENGFDVMASSGVLSSASSMLCVMLHSRFQEASTKIIEINTDEDGVDAEVFLDYCKIIHHCYDGKRKNTDTWYRQLAKIADMRGSTMALRPWIYYWLHNDLQLLVSRVKKLEDDHNSPPAKMPSLPPSEILRLAITFRFDYALWTTSKYIIAHTSVGEAPDDSESDYPLQLASIQSLIFEKKRELMAAFLTAVQGCVAKDIKPVLVDDGAETCLRSQIIWSHYEFFLISRHLALSNCLAYNGRISQAIKAIRTLAVEPVKAIRAVEFYKLACFSCTGQNCNYCKRKVQKELGSVLDGFVNKIPGLCLMCYNEGGEYWHAEPCVKHKAFMYLNAPFPMSG